MITKSAIMEFVIKRPDVFKVFISDWFPLQYAIYHQNTCIGKCGSTYNESDVRAYIRIMKCGHVCQGRHSNIKCCTCDGIINLEPCAICKEK